MTHSCWMRSRKLPRPFRMAVGTFLDVNTLSDASMILCTALCDRISLQFLLSRKEGKSGKGGFGSRAFNMLWIMWCPAPSTPTTRE